VRHVATQTLVGLERELRTTSESVGGLLALARADSGATATTMSEGYLDDIITDELPRWRETASMANVTILLGTFEEVHARFDAALIRRLLGLLLDNAIHYSRPGGRVAIDLRAVDGAVQLRVEDEGLGIAEGDREAVFQRFHRTAQARAHRADGSGLGLALARWIVEQHGGAIRAVGRDDGATGTVLVATWPCGVAEPLPVNRPRPSPPAAAAPTEPRVQPQLPEVPARL
jgi:signal transduction histidine kinase